MDINMDDSRIVSIPELREFLKVSQNIKFLPNNRKEQYAWINEILNLMTIHQTKSRARQTNDNALVEGKNGSIIRKWFGRNHIPRKYAPRINSFCEQYLNIYLNFHRPCGFAEVKSDHKGKQRKVYLEQNYLTPYQKLQTLENWTQYLAPGRTKQELNDICIAYSDTEFAILLQTERTKLFKSFKP